jgi:hypothetical protein
VNGSRRRRYPAAELNVRQIGDSVAQCGYKRPITSKTMRTMTTKPNPPLG